MVSGLYSVIQSKLLQEAGEHVLFLVKMLRSDQYDVTQVGFLPSLNFFCYDYPV